MTSLDHLCDASILTTFSEEYGDEDEDEDDGDDDGDDEDDGNDGDDGDDMEGMGEEPSFSQLPTLASFSHYAAPSESTRGRRGLPGRPSGRGRGTGKNITIHVSHHQDRGRRSLGAKPRGSAKGIKKGIRKAADPSSLFKALHSQATMAFIDHNYDAAEELVTQAIAENNEMFPAYSLLYEIHMARGDKHRALTALFTGAHTRHRDPDVWIKIAQLIPGCGASIKDAIYCYNRVLGPNENHVEARYARAKLYRELGSKGKAFDDYVRLLNGLPHDMAVLKSLAEVSIEVGQSTKAISLYDETISHCQSLESHTETHFTWSDVNIYSELFMYS
jgi:general transcription factor 3C polypeptide 3 (transcription factor C subunit 4)